MNTEFDVGSPAMQVTVFENGVVVAQVACESAQDAADAVAEWESRDGFECVVEDLSVTHGPDDVLAPEPEDVMAEEDDYRDEPD